eukprot:TRINITY_DN51005_c0_g1_i1.p1 TRINITY_DN51005_c0_g1~~TRINITY_DN51005_c0_g1_i1.p1  ORF type:complete len:253 (+),score=63.51 TRINITY_DN51005_c0_g1_i1:66-761(+)
MDDVPPEVVRSCSAAASLLRSAGLPPREDWGSRLGPHKYSNWVVPGKLCVGSFPCQEVWRREGRGSHLIALDALRDARVDLFVCLEAARDLVNSCTGLPIYAPALTPDWGARVLVFGGPDGGRFDWPVLGRCLEAVSGHLAAAGSGAVYVHCFGGHGRAGIVAACILGLAYGLPAAAALDLTQEAHDEREDPAWPLDAPQRSPQTEPQRQQVAELLRAVADAPAAAGCADL